MRFKTTLVFLGIFAAAALFFLVIERPRDERELERTARAGRFADISPGDVNRLTITRPDVTIAAERENDRWKNQRGRVFEQEKTIADVRFEKSIRDRGLDDEWAIIWRRISTF